MIFEHVANSIALELVNSVNNRHQPQIDGLSDVMSFSSWAKSIGRPLESPLKENDLAEGRELRELIYRVFRAVANSEDPAPADLASLVQRQAAGLYHSELTPSPRGYFRAWSQNPTPTALFAELSDNAVETLRTKPLHRIRQCPRCGWLFVDTTRNGTRKWCSMMMCGGQVKAQRHYYQKQETRQ